MFSKRFGLPVVIAVHARERMAARDIGEALLLDIIETGVDRDTGAGIIGSTSTIRPGRTTCCASPP
jgi:hypothetical protein